MITVSAFNELSAIRHGFFTRSGGVSEGLFGSLNCGFGSDDDIEKVAENRSRAMAMLGQPADALVTVYQVHSPNVVTVDERIPYDRSVEADAMVTNKPGIALGTLTQGEFLRRLGIEARAQILSRTASDEQRDDIASALKRLIAEDEMGTLFKVLALAHPAQPIPPGFDEQ